MSCPPLWDKALGAYLHRFPSDHGHPDFDVVTDTINDFHELDSHASEFGFRYPADRKNQKPTLQQAPEFINILRLHERMMEVSIKLIGMGDALTNGEGHPPVMDPPDARERRLQRIAERRSRPP